VTDSETLPQETLLRETFAEREHLAPSGDALADTARSKARARRWRRHTLGAVVACVVAALLSTAIVGIARNALQQQAQPAWTTTAVPDGWQVISSRGVQIAVPADWPINANDGCAVRAAFTVIRGPRIALDCLVPESPSATEVAVQAASLNSQDDDRLKGATTTSQVSLAGAPAVLVEGAFADGRTSMTLTVPGIDTQVAATGPDPSLLSQVLRTTRVVTVDDVGCDRDLPTATWDKPAPGPAIRPASPTSITVCVYQGALLGASATLEGSRATALTAAIAQAHAGPVRDNPRTCTPGLPEDLPLWLHLHYASGPDVDVRVHFANCTGRYMASPAGVSQVTMSVLSQALNPLQVGYATGSDLPKR
jgi:hypothetical protein